MVTLTEVYFNHIVKHLRVLLCEFFEHLENVFGTLKLNEVPSYLVQEKTRAVPDLIIVDSRECLLEVNRFHTKKEVVQRFGGDILTDHAAYITWDSSDLPQLLRKLSVSPVDSRTYGALTQAVCLSATRVSDFNPHILLREDIVCAEDCLCHLALFAFLQRAYLV